MKMLLLRKRGGRYDNDYDEEENGVDDGRDVKKVAVYDEDRDGDRGEGNAEEENGVDDDEILGGMSRRLLLLMRRARRKNMI